MPYLECRAVFLEATLLQSVRVFLAVETFPTGMREALGKLHPWEGTWLIPLFRNAPWDSAHLV